jgi:hypothetical protein
VGGLVHRRLDGSRILDDLLSEGFCERWNRVVIHLIERKLLVKSGEGLLLIGVNEGGLFPPLDYLLSIDNSTVIHPGIIDHKRRLISCRFGF